MGVLKDLSKKNLSNELVKLYDKFLTKKEDSESRSQLDKSIDDSGLKSPKTMQLVGLLQRTGKLQPGLYKELVGLNKKLEDGGESTESTQETSEASSASETATSSGEKAMTDKPVEGAAAKAADVTKADGFVLTEKDQEKIKAKIQKEEEKIRQRLLKYEQKQVERIKARAEKRAMRQGMKLEELQEIKERKEKLVVLREEIKERKAVVKKLKEEIKALRPKREKKDKKEAAAATPEKVEKKDKK